LEKSRWIRSSQARKTHPNQIRSQPVKTSTDIHLSTLSHTTHFIETRFFEVAVSLCGANPHLIVGLLVLVENKMGRNIVFLICLIALSANCFFGQALDPELESYLRVLSDKVDKLGNVVEYLGYRVDGMPHSDAI